MTLPFKPHIAKLPAYKPPAVPPGEHPRCLLSKAELDEFRKVATTAERAKGAYKALIGNAEAMCSAELDFPDPKGTPPSSRTAAARSRSGTRACRAAAAASATRQNIRLGVSATSPCLSLQR